MSSDAPNAFTQAKLNHKKGQARAMMKITGVLVEPLIKKAPHTHEGFAVMENGRKVIYLNTLRAIYGMLESASSWHRKF